MPCRVLRGSIVVLLALLSGCERPTAPKPGSTWARAAFGAGAVEWATDDVVGGWDMRPGFDSQHVYFERFVTMRNNMIVAPSQLVALDRSTGQLRWGYDIIHGVNAETTDDAVATIWGSLYVVNATGLKRYTFTYHDESLSSNVVSDGGRFFMLTWSGHALALDALTGGVQWDINLSGAVDEHGARVARAGDQLVATVNTSRTSSSQTDSGIVAVLDATTGNVRWRNATIADSTYGGGIQDEPLVASANVIVQNWRHRIMAFSLATGAPQWQFDASFGSPNVVSMGAATCEGRVIFATGDLGLVALDAQSGALQWKIPDLHAGSLTRVSCSHGTVLVLPTLEILDAATGRLLVRYPVSPMYPWSEQFGIYAAARDSTSIYVSTTLGFVRIRAPRP